MRITINVGMPRCRRPAPRWGLARANENRHAVPAPVLDRDTHRRICLAPGVGRDALLVQVALVLPSHGHPGIDRRHGAQRGSLSPPHVLGVEGGGRFHRDPVSYTHLTLPTN